MKDFFGNDLAVGDEVAFMMPRYRQMIMGKITKFTPQKMHIAYTTRVGYGSVHRGSFLATSDQVIKKL